MKKPLLLICPAAAIVLEMLPFGAVLVFAPAPTERVRESFSYFSLTPFGYANSAPLITALLTVSLMVFALVCALRNSEKLVKPVCIISGAAFVVSLLPLVFGIEYFTVIGGLISLLLAGELAIGLLLKKTSA